MEIRRFRRLYKIDITDENVKGLITRLERDLLKKENEIASLREKSENDTKQFKRQLKSNETELSKLQAELSASANLIASKEDEIAKLKYDITLLTQNLSEAETYCAKLSSQTMQTRKELLISNTNYINARNVITSLERQLDTAEARVEPYRRLKDAHIEILTTYENCITELDKHKQLLADYAAKTTKAGAEHSATIEELKRTKAELAEKRDHLKKLQNR